MKNKFLNIVKDYRYYIIYFFGIKITIKNKEYAMHAHIDGRHNDVMKLIAKNLISTNNTKNYDNIQDYEFKIYSQWGEDGIIQYLINNIPIENKTFIEFGVENYSEANTRFLMENNNWAGLIIDGSESNINYTKNQDYYWRYNLTAVHSFITKDNINSIFKENGFVGDIGLLSIDIDGIDYFIFESIDCIKPRIIICEYNSIFGCDRSVTVPYDPSFQRWKKHYSDLYFGASIKAFTYLANKKGYSLVGSTQAGNNLFFVRNDVLSNLKVLSPEEAYIKSLFRESRYKNRERSYLNYDEAKKLIKDMPVLDVVSADIINVD